MVPVTSRISEDGLYHELTARQQEWAAHGLSSVSRIGDCLFEVGNTLVLVVDLLVQATDIHLEALDFLEDGFIVIQPVTGFVGKLVDFFL